MRSVEYYRGREQTYVKHFFLERYLTTLAYHIGYFRPNFVYVDCFSGPWKAADEEFGDTSIRIALDVLNKVQGDLSQHRKSPAIGAVFVEEDKKAYADLRHVLQEHSGVIETTALHGKFEGKIAEMLDRVGSSFGFFFIDPKGWKAIPMQKLEPILKRQNGEVMINFMYDYVNRFLNDRRSSIEKTLDDLFGTGEWRSLRNASNRESEIVQFYVEQVRAAGGFPHATYTRVLIPLRNRPYYHLIYATRHRKGIAEFREVEKKSAIEQDLVRDAAKRLHRTSKTGQHEIEFEAEQPTPMLQHERELQLSKAEERLVGILKAGPLAYQSLQPRILELPLVWSSDLNKALVAGHRSGRFVIEGFTPRQRAPKDQQLVRLGTGIRRSQG